MEPIRAARTDGTVDTEAPADYRIDVSRFDASVLVRIAKMAFRYRGRMSLAIVATVMAASFQLFVPQFLGRAVDQAQGLLAGAEGQAAKTAAAEALFTTALLLIGAAVARGLCTCMQNYQGEAVGQSIGYDLRRAYYRKLQQLSYSWHDRVHSGDLMTRGILDIEGVRLFVDTGILRSFLLTVLIGGGGVVLWRIDPTLSMVALAFVPIVGIRASLARLKLRDTWLALQDELSTLTKAMEENLGGLRVVRAFAAQAHELARYDTIGARALAISHRRINLFVQSTTQMTFVYFLTMGLVLWVGGQKTLDGEITLGELAEFLAFMTILQMPVRQIGWMVNSLARASTCGGRLFAVLDIEPSIRDAETAIPLPEGPGVLRFENVSFRYPAWAADERTLAGISFEAGPGRTIGIVGPPGSGKTTIAHLMGRYHDVGDGRITIDGHDIRDLTLESLRLAVAVVQQDPFLFTSSIDHNVAYGDPWAGRPDIERSAQAAQLHNYIRGLPGGYETLVGERGVTLSGGQRQRLAIARGILPEARVLVFDDSTAAVDAGTERRIRQELRETVKDRAVVIIAHRLSSLMHADEILFLDAGRIIERGSHDELLAAGGRYADLYGLQARAGEDAP